ncbi:MAG TPA: hypothetical protein VHQ47_17820 [Phycisphaerae bacterium]|nr:hypothetical protein [Phycisphaerae bacterium]
MKPSDSDSLRRILGAEAMGIFDDPGFSGAQDTDLRAFTQEQLVKAFRGCFQAVALAMADVGRMVARADKISSELLSRHGSLVEVAERSQESPQARKKTRRSMSPESRARISAARKKW